MARQWEWLARETVLDFHEEQLAEHGGPSGLRDENMFMSALDRPRNQAAYGDPDIADLAAAYAFGFARNHPFVDGNKRTAAIAAELFLDLNGFEMTATDAEVVIQILALAAGELGEQDLADWYRGNLRKHD
ncbi:MAG: type II toxin-antitoxin system death-on-curing family toxin [Pacificimonas sp.]